MWIALVSPRDCREQNLPSVVVPEKGISRDTQSDKPGRRN